MRILTSLPEFLFLVASVSTGAVLLAWIGSHLLRGRSAAWRHFIWLLALCAPLLVLLFDLMPARLTLPLLPPVAQQVTPAKAILESPPVVPASFSASAAPAPAITKARIPPTFNLWLSVWLVGATLTFARMLWSQWHLTRMLRQDLSRPPDSLLRRLEEVKKLFGSPRRVDLLTTALTRIPFCHGIFQPVIVFPADWTRWPDERVDVCLTHELAHIHRGDLPSMLAGQVACILCWFNPLVWLAAARLQDEAENAADDVVLAKNISPETYAANLVAITEDCKASAFSPVLTLSMARPNRLKLRVDAILDPSLRRESPGFVRLASLGLLAGFALAAVMTVRLTAAPTVASASTAQDLVEIRPRSAIWREAYDAIKAGNLGTIDSLLKRGLDVNADLISNRSLLFLAVDENQEKIVKLLLAKGADVNQKTSWGDTALHRACWRGNKVIADMLIAAGAPKFQIVYCAGMLNVRGLEERDKAHPISVDEARHAITCALVAGRQNTFDWLWRKLEGLDETEKGKLLGEYFERAAEWGQPGMLRHLETLGVSVKAYGTMALTKAASRNSPQAVKLLLEAGVSPNDPPPQWNRVLRDAAGEGHLELVKVLLDHGAEPNFRDSGGLTPLSWAAYCGHEDVCLLLLEHGADGNIKDSEGRNAAWHAAGGVHCPEALEVMIAKGVTIAGTNKHGDVLLNAMMNFVPPRPDKIGFPGKVYSAAEMKAFDARERRVIDLLVAAGADFNGQPGTTTPLMSALNSGHNAAARALLDHKVDVSLVDSHGNSALSSIFNSTPLPVDVFERVLKLGGNPNPEIQSYSNGAPKSLPLLGEAISYAANLNYDAAPIREAIKILLANGADFPQVENADGQQLLQAAAKGDLSAIQAAVRQGTSINTRDGDGWVALAITAALGYGDCSAWLIQNGAAVDLPARRRPLALAIQSGQTSLVELLISKGAKLDAGGNGLPSVVHHNNQRLFDILIRTGADAKAGGISKVSHDGGKTWSVSPESMPLFSCIKNGNAKMAKTLLEKGANPDPANLTNDRSILYWAVNYNQPEIVSALIERGANPSAKDSEGVTPLALAQKEQKHLVPVIEESMKRAAAKTEN